MQTIKGYYNGKTFVPTDSVNWAENDRVIIMRVDDLFEKKDGARYLGKITDDNYVILSEALERGEKVEYDYDDPFYSPEHLAELRRRIKDIESGKTVLVERELIEVEDDE